MTGPGCAEPSRHRIGSSLLSWAGTTLMVVLTVVVCLGVMWAALWAGAGTLWDANDNVTLESWTHGIGITAQRVAQIVTVAGVALGVTGAVSAVAAWRRNRLWTRSGAICSAMLVAALIAGGALGYSSLSAIIDGTHEQIGAVRLTGTPPSEVTVPLDQAEAEAGMRQLLETTATFTSGPVSSINQSTGETRPLDPRAVELVRESCTPDPDGKLGVQLRVVFTMPSDEQGVVVQRVLDAWAQAGYVRSDRIRDHHQVGSDTLPVGLASINDRFTIDGTAVVTLVSRCAKGLVGGDQ